MKVIVIGGGAAGFFAAINCAILYPQYQISIIEKSPKVLSKVKISGGGRCNLSHHQYNLSKLVDNYPRGSKFLKKVMGKWAVKETLQWFEDRGVPTVAEADGRIFPVANTSQAVIDCLWEQVRRYKIKVITSCTVDSIRAMPNQQWQIQHTQGKLTADKIIIAIGGHPKRHAYHFLEQLGLDIIQPAPSLFTYNLRHKDITALQGLSVPNACVKVVQSKTKHKGALLITHWGMSGPAVLRSSAFNARLLQDLEYRFDILISWIDHQEEAFRQQLHLLKTQLKHRQLSNKNPFELPKRLWDFLLQRVDLDPQKKWLDLSKSDVNRLLNVLLYDAYQVQGKTTFKEEFVTCGGVSLDEIDPKTMQSKRHKGIYLAGEVLDIDGVTGGYNFQAAWSTAYIASRLG